MLPPKKLPMAQRFGNWLLTENGATFGFRCAVTALGGNLMIRCMSQTYLLNYYRTFFQFYTDGFATPVPKELQQRLKETLDLLKIPEEDHHLYKPFMAFGFDILSFGTTYTRFGALIGLPSNYTYADEASVDKSGIQVKGQTVRWELPDGKLLQKSLVLSDNAQKYAIAREIKMCDTPKNIIDVAFSTTCMFLTYAGAKICNERYNFLSKPRGLRYTFYSLVGLLFYGNYIFLKDVMQVHYESKIDEELKKESPIFAKGGKEFYSCILNRNIALRNIMGIEGTNKYTVFGNENYWFRQRHLPLVQRRDFFVNN